MKLINTFISALCLGLASFSLIQAGPLVSRTSAPPPTRPFTASAFDSPYPLGQHLTGYNLTARNGNLYLSGKANAQKAVLFTDAQTNGWLNSKTPQQLYIDTSSGLLAYANPAPAGAVFPGFAHFGHGTDIYVVINSQTEPAPGAFEWTGTTYANNWFACPVGGNEYQLYKLVSIFGGTPPLVYGTTCLSLYSVSALDYSGASPAVDSYS